MPPAHDQRYGSDDLRDDSTGTTYSIYIYMYIHLPCDVWRKDCTVLSYRKYVGNTSMYRGFDRPMFGSLLYFNNNNNNNITCFTCTCTNIVSIRELAQKTRKNERTASRDHCGLGWNLCTIPQVILFVTNMNVPTRERVSIWDVNRPGKSVNRFPTFVPYRFRWSSGSKWAIYAKLTQLSIFFVFRWKFGLGNSESRPTNDLRNNVIDFDKIAKLRRANFTNV